MTERMIDILARARELAHEQLAAARTKASRLGASDEDIARAGEIRRLAELAEATRDVVDAQRQAADVEQRAAAADRAVTEHAAAVEREAERITTTERDLEASRTRLVKAVKAADAALMALWDAGSAHDALVAERSAELRAAGLSTRYADGDLAVDHDTGGAADGLILRGAWWVRVDPGRLLYRCLYGALRARLGVTFPGAGPMRYQHVERLERQSAGLLDKAPLPAAHVPDRAWLATLAERHAVVVADEEALHLVSDARREDAERDRQREEREQRDTAARVKQRLKRIERTGEAFFA